MLRTLCSPYDDPKSFVALSMALETVGGSAYMGAAQFLHSKSTLRNAAVSVFSSSYWADVLTYRH